MLCQQPVYFSSKAFRSKCRSKLANPDATLAELGLRVDKELHIAVRGHQEEFIMIDDAGYHTIYNIKCQLVRDPGASENLAAAAAWTSSCSSPVRRPSAWTSECRTPSKTSLESGESAVTVASLASESSGRAWRCGRRLCDIRENLHDVLVHEMGREAYSLIFAATPFARHGGLPGTTDRLRRWFQTLASSINDGRLEPRLCALALAFLGAPTADRDAGYAADPDIPAMGGA